MAMVMKSVKFDRETLDKLEGLARIRDRDISYLVRQAVDELIERYEWQVEEVEKTLEGIDSGKVPTRPLEGFLSELEDSQAKPK